MRCKSELREEQTNAANERGVKLALRVAGEFESRNPRAIADRVGVKVEYLRWPLVTVGEFDSKNLTINVNLNALQFAKQETDRWFSADALLDAIVAHELGHFFALREGQNSVENDRAMDEVVAQSFTETLLELPFSSHKYEGLWRN